MQIKLEHGNHCFDRDCSFILDGNSFPYSSQAFKHRCMSLPVDIYNIPKLISSDALILFIESLEQTEIEFNPLLNPELYALSLIFGYNRLSEVIRANYAIKKEINQILDQMILNEMSQIDNISLEDKFATYFHEVSNIPLLHLLKPEKLVRMVKISKISSNDIIELIKMLRNHNKIMENYLGLYTLIEYSDLSMDHRSFLLTECKDEKVNMTLADTMFRHIKNLNKKRELLSKEIKARKEIIEKQADIIQNFHSNESEDQLCIGLKIHQGHFFLKAAELGNVEAERMAGYYFLEQANELKSKKKKFILKYFSNRSKIRSFNQLAIEWFTKAAEHGDDVAQYMIGSLEKSFNWLMKSAIQNNSDAQFLVGKAYHDGLIANKDYEQAFEWFMKAIEHGNRDAEEEIGYMYYRGEFVSKDYDQALYWLKRAEEQGKVELARIIGIISHGKNKLCDGIANDLIVLQP